MNIKPYVLLTVVALLLINLTARAQDPSTTTSSPDITPVIKSPNAMAMDKFGSNPVSLSTGVPDISVPIFNLGVRGLNIPISLGYNASGIKVEEFATNVGLGWMLNCGGAITDQVNGIPDFDPDGWMDCSKATPQGAMWEEQFPDEETFQNDTDYYFYEQVLKGVFDTQPDEFNLSYPGGSNKFYFDQRGNIYLESNQRIKIARQFTTDGTNRFIGFSMVDENDNQYTFETEEDAINTNHGISFTPIKRVPTFYLSQVTTPAGDTVTFNYGSVEYTINNQISETRFADPGTYQRPANVAQPTYQNSISTTDQTEMKLLSVSTSAGDTVKFSYGANRLDITASQPVTGISVYHKTTLVKSFNLYYDYFTSGVVGSTDPNDYRLRLDSVQEAGKSPYRFTYSSIPLPNRLSFAQDHWGFYNGANTNTILNPVDSAHQFLTGADRNPHPQYTQAGLLTGITYPTGGNTTYTYESNINFGPEITANQPVSRANCYSMPTGINTSYFTVPTGAHDFLVSYTTLAPANDSNLELPPGPTTTIQIWSTSTNQLVHQFCSSNNYESASYLTPGNYEIKVCAAPTGSTLFINVYWRLAGESSSDSSARNYDCGGIRVKTMTDAPDANPADAIVTNYQYTQDGDSTKSSNVWGVIPVYISNYNVMYTPEGSNWYAYTFNSQSNSSQLSLSSVSGGNSFYDFVTVYKQGKSVNGYTTYKFTNQPVGGGVVVWPYTPLVAYNWFYSQVLESKTYKYNPGNKTYNIVNKTTNNYHFAFSPANGSPFPSGITGLKIAQVLPGIQRTGPLNPPSAPQFFVGEYSLNSYWFYLSGKTETTYDPADSTQFNRVNYTYAHDNTFHLETTRETISRSNGENYHILYRYPLDVFGSYAYNASPVIEKRVMINNGTADRLVKAELTQYLNHPGVFPTSYYTLNEVTSLDSAEIPLYTGGTINSAYLKRADYSYNSQMNLSGTVMDSQVKTAYQWGYNNQYPVAECKNAAPNDIFYDSFEEGDGNGTYNDAKTGHYSHTGSYSKALTGLDNGSYLLTYWQNNGAGWVFETSTVTVTGGGYSIGLGGTGVKIDDVRFYPANSLMTTYTYDPLIGITSTTDPKGEVSFYEYDTFSRLMNIKDTNGNIIKHMDYHYQGQ